MKEELDSSSVANFATVQIEGTSKVERNIEYYNLDIIISVGYRVKSQRGVEFRQWANKVLKQYILQGYAINEKRLDYLNKTVEIESKIIAHMAEIDADEMLSVINGYTNALDCWMIMIISVLPNRNEIRLFPNLQLKNASK